MPDITDVSDDAAEGIRDTQTGMDIRDVQDGDARADISDTRPSDSRENDLRDGGFDTGADLAPTDSEGETTDGDTMRPDISPDAGIPATLRPEVIYVPEANHQAIARLYYINGELIQRTFATGEEVRALGPSFQYDSDPAREVPYAVRTKNSSIKLEVAELDGSDSKTLAGDIMTNTQYSHLGIADHDGDGELGVMYPKSRDKINIAEEPQIESIIVESSRRDQNVDPKAIMGAVILGRDDSGGQQIMPTVNAYWSWGSKTAVAVLDDTVDGVTARFNRTPFDIGTNNNYGVGPPRRFGGYPYMPVIDSNGRAGVIRPEMQSSPVGTPVFVQLVPSNTDREADKAPLGFGDVDGDGQYELVFLMNGKLTYVSVQGVGLSTPTILKMQGNAIEAFKKVGVTSGVSTFQQRRSQGIP